MGDKKPELFDPEVLALTAIEFTQVIINTFFNIPQHREIISEESLQAAISSALTSWSTSPEASYMELASLINEHTYKVIPFNSTLESLCSDRFPKILKKNYQDLIKQWKEANGMIPAFNVWDIISFDKEINGKIYHLEGVVTEILPTVSKYCVKPSDDTLQHLFSPDIVGIFVSFKDARPVE